MAVRQITPKDIGPRCAEILEKFGVYERNNGGFPAVSRCFVDFMKAELIKQPTLNLYIKLTRAIVKWCSDTDSNHMERFIMIEALALTMEADNPMFAERMQQDRKDAHEYNGLSPDSLVHALYLADSIHEQQEEMK